MGVVEFIGGRLSVAPLATGAGEEVERREVGAGDEDDTKEGDNGCELFVAGERFVEKD